MEEKHQAVLQCIFCGSSKFEYDENNMPKDGDMIKCSNCGKLNDLSSIKKLAIYKKVSEIKTEFTNEIQDKLNKMVRKFNKKIK